MIAFLPDGITWGAAAALMVVSLLSSALTAAVGIGGGIVFLVALTFVVPIEALIALHGIIQVGSNAGRTIVLARQVNYRLLLPFVLGATVGVAIGAALVTDLPEATILLAIGVFVTVTTWVKPPPFGRGQPAVLAIGGAGASILTMFIGATGPFVIAMMRQTGLSHIGLVATNGAAMTVQHALKVIAFGILGFNFMPWLPLVAALIASGFVGTLIGARLLRSLPEQALRMALKVVLTMLGLHLIVRGVLDLL
ncbi:sulfite exporter TauE/SafE family protein [Acuticoccus sp. MNP-M23]|uniref:sulfite exporter TauE/SafE family protein n=1 Tax=Acuticoccus sp. MNP-M23 TaxID=3072793 RepID=UPI002814BECF|nr:sulfite exporter TauE/SafE family protein [Acuticoccus sp. MNP-M23]WMS44174.1 sulfite exporter TauE/SafE family protein [Acuticoccus sp. MNP-M23]